MAKGSKKAQGAASARTTKKTPRKTPRKKAATKKPAKKAGHSAQAARTKAAVWEAYPRLLSIRAVARELGTTDWTVRRVLEGDRERLSAMIGHFQEELAAQWERTHQRCLGIIDHVLRIAEAMLAEIQEAAREDRITRIRDKDGYYMPVLDAMQFVVMTRLLDQVNRLSQQAQAISTAYRTGDPWASVREAGSDGGAEDFERMSDMELAAVIRRGGLKLPPLLERKVKMVEAREGSQSGEGTESAHAGDPKGE